MVGISPPAELEPEIGDNLLSICLFSNPVTEIVNWIVYHVTFNEINSV